MAWRVSGIVALGLVAGILLARAAQDPDIGTASWDGLRAAGFASYLCLWFSVGTGIAVHMRFRVGRAPLTWVLEAHRISSALSASFLTGHAAGLLVDPTVAFSVLDVLFGLGSEYRPLEVALGSAAMWLVAAVLVSTALSAKLPYATWRNIHYVSFAAYPLALVHGITAGTDSGSPLAAGLYAVTAASVAALLVARVLGRGWVAAET